MTVTEDPVRETMVFLEIKLTIAVALVMIVIAVLVLVEIIGTLLTLLPFDPFTINHLNGPCFSILRSSIIFGN